MVDMCPKYFGSTAEKPIWGGLVRRGFLERKIQHRRVGPRWEEDFQEQGIAWTGVWNPAPALWAWSETKRRGGAEREGGGGPILRPSAVRLRDMGLTGESIWGSFLKKPRYSSYQKFPARGQPLLLRTRHGDSFMTGPCISYSKFNEQKKMPLPEESQYCIFDFLLKNFWLGSVGGMELSCFMILIKCLLIKKNP